MTQRPDGDRVVVDFYHNLWRKGKTFEPCKDVLIPDTVVFRHFPTEWFTSLRMKPSDAICERPGCWELKRLTGKDIDGPAILAAFAPKKGAGRETRPSCSGVESKGIVSCWLYNSDAGAGIEFQTAQQLHAFVMTRNDSRIGILQKFVHGKGINSVVQITWSPRLSMLQRRVIAGDTNRDARVRAQPDNRWDLGHCSKTVTNHVKAACRRMARHITATDREGKIVTGMVAYFKIAAAGRIYFLWCGSLQYCTSLIPPLPTSPDESRRDRGALPAMAQVIRRQLPSLKCSPGEKPEAGKRRPGTGTVGEAKARQQRASATPPPPAAGSSWADRIEREDFHELLEQADRHASRAFDNWAERGPADLQVQAAALRKRRDRVRVILDDVLYTAAASLQTCGVQTELLVLPNEVQRLTSPAAFAALAQALSLSVRQGDGSSDEPALSAERLITKKTACTLHSMRLRANAFVEAFFGEKEAALQRRLMPHLEAEIVRRSLP